mmetsp:Transcript_10273/g.23423  ORF Transcript_10273/g.23423 Transcript_10273/m.23423 type:complete len:370 (+) Transcript_10273:635-1744(+)
MTMTRKLHQPPVEILCIRRPVYTCHPSQKVNSCWTVEERSESRQNLRSYRLSCNVMLIVMINVEGNQSTLAWCQKGVERFLEVNPTIIVLCTPHICRTVRHWSQSNERQSEHRQYKSQYTRMLMHVMYHGSKTWDITELLVQMGIVIYILTEKNLGDIDIDRNTLLRKNSCKEELKQIGREMNAFINEQKAVIKARITSFSMDELIEKEVSMPFNKQQWLAKELVKVVVSSAVQRKLRFAHCYLHERKSDGTKGILKVSVVHGIDTSQDCIHQSHDYISDLRPKLNKGEDPMTYQYLGCNSEDVMYQVVGGFKTCQLDLPHRGPLYNPVQNTKAAEYLLNWQNPNVVICCTTKCINSSKCCCCQQQPTL